MPSSRVATAVAGLAVSLAVSLLAWHYLHTFVFFLFLPFVPLLWRRRSEGETPRVRECPACGFRTADAAFDYCPRDGTELESADSGGD